MGNVDVDIIAVDDNDDTLFRDNITTTLMTMAMFVMIRYIQY